MVAAAGAGPSDVTLIGVVPEWVATGVALSAPVRAAIEPVMALVAAELERLGAPARRARSPGMPIRGGRRRQSLIPNPQSANPSSPSRIPDPHPESPIAIPNPASPSRIPHHPESRILIPNPASSRIPILIPSPSSHPESRVCCLGSDDQAIAVDVGGEMPERCWRGAGGGVSFGVVDAAVAGAAVFVAERVPRGHAAHVRAEQRPRDDAVCGPDDVDRLGLAESEHVLARGERESSTAIAPGGSSGARCRWHAATAAAAASANSRTSRRECTIRGVQPPIRGTSPHLGGISRLSAGNPAPAPASAAYPPIFGRFRLHLPWHPACDRNPHTAVQVFRFESSGWPPSVRRAGRRIEIRGTVQGVGFRPWVYRVARAAAVTGRVRNDDRGVTIEAFGSSSALDAFVDRLADAPERPAAATIEALTSEPIPFGRRAASRSSKAGRTTSAVFDPAGPGDLPRMPRRDCRPGQPAVPLPVHELHELRSAVHHRRRDPLRPRQYDDDGLRDLSVLPSRVRGRGRSAVPRASRTPVPSAVHGWSCGTPPAIRFRPPTSWQPRRRRLSAARSWRSRGSAASSSPCDACSEAAVALLRVAQASRGEAVRVDGRDAGGGLRRLALLSPEVEPAHVAPSDRSCIMTRRGSRRWPPAVAPGADARG